MSFITNTVIPYGRAKLLLRDYTASSSWQAIVLRHVACFTRTLFMTKIFDDAFAL